MQESHCHLVDPVNRSSAEAAHKNHPAVGNDGRTVDKAAEKYLSETNAGNCYNCTETHGYSTGFQDKFFDSPVIFLTIVIGDGRLNAYASGLSFRSRLFISI